MIAMLVNATRIWLSPVYNFVTSEVVQLNPSADDNTVQFLMEANQVCDLRCVKH